MANTELIKKLTKKWSKPEGMPGKGYELVREERGLSPCAQTGEGKIEGRFTPLQP